MSERFTFGVPLIARAAVGDWGVVDRLFAATLQSVLAQDDPDFTLLLAGHERPPAWERAAAGDRRFRFLRADWPPEPPSAANDDGGRKKWAIKAAVRAMGGGLLMFLDGDDWVDRGLVAAARAVIGPGCVGGLIADGVAVDYATGRAAAFPVAGGCPDGYAGAFHELCGSSTVARIDMARDEPVARDPHGVLGSHGEWEARARAGGHRLARLDVWGAYLVGTPGSHSEHHGPFAEWRRAFAGRVRRDGRALSAVELARFGQAGWPF